MPKLQLFEIELENSSGVYHVGNVVAGRVVIHLSEEMKIREVRLKIIGRAKAYWTDTRTESRQEDDRTTYHTHTDHYSCEQKYFDHKITLSSNPTLPPGIHTFPFKYRLPSSCPTSFEGDYGNIRYIVEANIDWPWNIDQPSGHKTKRAFTVLQWMDLNEDPRTAQPHTEEGHKTFCCWCCEYGKITWQITLPKTGYVAGELVAVTGQIVNNSERIVDKVRMRIIQNATFRASCGLKNQLKERKKVLAEMVKQSVGPDATQIWNNDGVRLPPVPMPFGDDGVIGIYYTVEFHIVPQGPAISAVFTFPITVGCVPLRQPIPQFQQENRQFYVGLVTEQPIGLQPTAPYDAVYPNLPPMNYVETTTGKVDIKEGEDNEYTMGQLRYAPLYPYYGWTTAPTSETARGPYP